MKKVGACILLSLAVGCGVGEDGPGTTGTTGLDGETDDRDEKLGIVCNATFDVTGSFTAGTPARPLDTPTGCWPVGTWTFSATVESNECATAPVLASTYAFRVDRADPDGTGWQETYTFMGDQSMLYRLKVSEGGGGDCEGGLELYSGDGTEYWNLKPALVDNVISGFGEYAKYKTNQK